MTDPTPVDPQLLDLRAITETLRGGRATDGWIASWLPISQGDPAGFHEVMFAYAGARRGMVDSNNVIGLEATQAAFAHGETWRQALIAYLQGNRDWLAQAVATRLPGITMRKPQGTFLAWLDCGALGLGADLASFFVEQAKVGMSAGTEFGEAGRNFMRLNFGCTRATLEEGVARIETALRAR